jgi:hypothetical protein
MEFHQHSWEKSFYKILPFTYLENLSEQEFPQLPCFDKSIPRCKPVLLFLFTGGLHPNLGYALWLSLPEVNRRHRALRQGVRQGGLGTCQSG